MFMGQVNKAGISQRDEGVSSPKLAQGDLLSVLVSSSF
jgi:hypothetical protein